MPYLFPSCEVLSRVGYKYLGECTDMPCKHHVPFDEIKVPPKKHLQPLAEIVICEIMEDEKLIHVALTNLPHHLVNIMMRVGLQHKKYLGVSLLVAEWPLEKLELHKIYPEGKESLFETTLEADTAIIMGLMQKGEKFGTCKMQYLDLRGFHLNPVFQQFLTWDLPVLCIKKRDRDVNLIVDQYIKNLTLTDPEVKQVILSRKEEIKQYLKTKLTKFDDVCVQVPTGQRLTVQIETHLYNYEKFRMDLIVHLLAAGLGELTPYKLEFVNLVIPASKNVSAKHTEYNLITEVLLSSQDPQMLKGLRMDLTDENLIESLFEKILHFKNLKALDLSHSKIDIGGITRSQVTYRSRFVSLLHSFSQLTRLDLAKCPLTGHFIAVLDWLPQPLEFLNVSKCGISSEEVEYLGRCKHTKSLKELHISSLLTPVGLLDSPDPILDVLPKLKDLKMLEMRDSELSSAHQESICSALLCLGDLKILDLRHNPIPSESVAGIVFHGAEHCPSLHCLTFDVFYVLPSIDGNFFQYFDARNSLQQRCNDIVKQTSRTDMVVNIFCLYF